MRTIWKWTLSVTDEQTVEMPKGAEVLSVAEQQPTAGRAIQVWALVDPSASKVQRRLSIYGTGNPITKAPGQFIGSVLAGPFVWHVFDHGEVA